MLLTFKISWCVFLCFMYVFMVGCAQGLGGSGNKLMEFLEEDGRLEKPADCPLAVYETMLKCWKKEYVVWFYSSVHCDRA